LQQWEKQINVGGNKKEKLREISVYTLDKFTKAVCQEGIMYDVNITLCKRNDKKIYQVSKHYTRGDELFLRQEPRDSHY